MICHNDLANFDETVHLKVNGTKDPYVKHFEPIFNPSSIYSQTTEIKFEGSHKIPSTKELSSESIKVFDKYMREMLISLGNKDIFFNEEQPKL